MPDKIAKISSLAKLMILCEILYKIRAKKSCLQEVFEIFHPFRANLILLASFLGSPAGGCINVAGEVFGFQACKSLILAVFFRILSKSSNFTCVLANERIYILV